MTDQRKPYIPLNTDNSALVLVDHRVGSMTGVRDYETGELNLLDQGAHWEQASYSPAP
jgi:hypothetical protein